MAEYDYRSTADLLAAEKNKAHDQSTSELFKALVNGNQQRRLEAEKAGRQEAFLQPYLDGTKKLPSNIDSVSYDQAQLRGPDPAAAAYKQQMMQDREDRQSQNEYSKMQSRYDKLIQPSIDKIRAADLSEDYIKQNNFKGLGTEQITNTKAAIGQRMAANEIMIANHPSLAQSLRMKMAQWTNDNNAPILTKDEQNLLFQLNNTPRAHAVDDIEKIHKGFLADLPNSAPVSSRLGKTDSFAKNLTDYKNSLIARPQSQPGMTSSGAVAIQPIGQSQQTPGIAGFIGRAVSAGKDMLLGPNMGTSPSNASQMPQQQPSGTNQTNNNFSGFVPSSQPRTPTGKMYSKSRNQTKITYSDGSEEVVDGQQ